jgi:hypothetical protein
MRKASANAFKPTAVDFDRLKSGYAAGQRTQGNPEQNPGKEDVLATMPPSRGFELSGSPTTE